ncbi:hypothetical protein AHAS_Ahas04G0062200 [Arachis hypogaea]
MYNDVGKICEQLPALQDLNLSNNLVSPYKSELPPLESIRILVLNDTGVDWQEPLNVSCLTGHVEWLRQSLTAIEELHLIGINISRVLGYAAITLKCVGASMGEKQPFTKKLPATTTGSPLPVLLDNDTSSLLDLGIGNESFILVAKKVDRKIRN